MMGVAENIADLRSLLSIVAEDTGALTLDDADEESVGWTTEGPLPMTFGHVRRAYAVLAALEAALSTDAEPVATVAEMGVGGMRVLIPHPPGSTQHLPIGTKLYADPVKTAPAVAEDAQVVWEVYHRIRDGEDVDVDRIDALGKLYNKLAALSAQVQDVANGYSCDLCHHSISYDAIVPNEVWNTISPSGDCNGVLCANCIVEKLKYPAALIVNAHEDIIPAQMQDVAGLELRPHEPTKEMLAAAMKADQDGFSASMKTIWMVMWAAYRASPASKHGDAE